MSILTSEDRQIIRRSLDGAMLNVAIYAASLHVGRRIIVRLNRRNQYEIKYIGLKWSLFTTASLPDAVRFLDNLGVPGKRVSLGRAA